MKLILSLVLMLAASATAARLRGSTPARELSDGGPSAGECNPTTSAAWQNIPGLSEYTKGVNVVTGRLTERPLLNFGNEMTFFQNGPTTCYRAPSDYSFNFGEGHSKTTFSSSNAKDAKTFHEELSKEITDKYKLDMKGEGWGFKAALNAAYTDSSEMNNIRNTAKNNHEFVSALNIDVTLFTANPGQSTRFSLETVNTWKTLMKNANYTNAGGDSGSGLSWREYFAAYGTHVPTTFRVGGSLHFQALTSVSDFDASEEKKTAFNNCLEGSASAEGGVFGGSFDIKGEVEKCVKSAGITSSSEKGDTAKTTVTAGCFGAAPSCPILVDAKNGSFTPPTMTRDAQESWRDALMALPQVEVDQTEWITQMLRLSYAAGRGAFLRDTMHGMSKTKFDALVRTMEEMLGQYLSENGMCTKFPEACGYEVRAMDLFTGDVKTLVETLPYIYTATMLDPSLAGKEHNEAKIAAMETVTHMLQQYDVAQEKLSEVAASLAGAEVTDSSVQDAQQALADAVAGLQGDVWKPGTEGLAAVLSLLPSKSRWRCVKCGGGHKAGHPDAWKACNAMTTATECASAGGTWFGGLEAALQAVHDGLASSAGAGFQVSSGTARTYWKTVMPGKLAAAAREMKATSTAMWQTGCPFRCFQKDIKDIVHWDSIHHALFPSCRAADWTR